ncbi:hypothetical protein BJF93_16355 [Xaviernesmea oryzae]|uniref:Uncharacterized protein n=1 Tax=Xaviernesmea oryzae TaxID=464029 RepID=A0A1Q9ASU9_9HYPH|nr:hypothetical protein [Xaviernesmea oryzae]OLP58449.1 hypothetical protein BJF93_16355 [Xaviernesmea oryzae]SEM22160.1 hypothetical protein SAMN04487976_12335 [Xaviernesmea oryzae]
MKHAVLVAMLSLSSAALPSDLTLSAALMLCVLLMERARRSLLVALAPEHEAEKWKPLFG